MKADHVEKLRAALADALGELQQAQGSATRGIERQWVALVLVKVSHAAELADGVEPEPEPVEVLADPVGPAVDLN